MFVLVNKKITMSNKLYDALKNSCMFNDTRIKKTSLSNTFLWYYIMYIYKLYIINYVAYNESVILFIRKRECVYMVLCARVCVYVCVHVCVIIMK